MALIVTLSSIPPRFPQLGPTLETLLAQTARADRVILYIPRTYRRFPDWDGALPAVPAGVEIVRADRDFGPSTKLLPALRAFAGQDVEILFCDDDRHYPPDWAASFLAARRAHPDCAIAQRGLDLTSKGLVARPDRKRPRARPRERSTDLDYQVRYLWRRLRAWPSGRRPRPPARRRFRRSGYVDSFEGCAGVLVRPEFFDPRVFDIPGIAWAHDDIWLSAALAARGTDIWLTANRYTPQNTAARGTAALADEAIGGVDRLELTRQVVALAQTHLGVWR